MCGRYYKQLAAKAGDIAGNVTSEGRVQLNVDGKNYRAHRVAWFYVYGKWAQEIDHLDGNTSNNAITNLREADRFMNMQNRRRARVGSSSGVLGVTRRSTPKGDRFIAQLCVDRKTRYLGIFKTAEQAHAVYLAAKRKHHEGCTI
jgi:hypothetical protein